MNRKRLCLVMLLLVTGCRQSEIGGDKSILQINKAITGAEFIRQLKINEDALLKGSTEQIRVDAATVMLFSDNPLAREVLLRALKQSENNAARAAVCRALGQARASQEFIKGKGDFIEPLFEIIAAEDSEKARLAAEATLIFNYDQIAKHLDKILAEKARPAKARLNVTYVLKLQPDVRAMIQLVNLLGDPDSRVAAEAETALRTIGVPVSKDPEVRRQIVNALRHKGKDILLREWLIRQEEQMRRLDAEIVLWQKLYLDSLNRIYNGINIDAEKSKFLAEHLANSKVAVKLWAVEKVSQWRVGTKSKLPTEELGPILINLISDADRNVRLKTAQLLSLMGELNSAEKLLEQLKVEQDDEVRTELFVALGEACYYAFLPNSGIKLAPEIKKQTLELASGYLSSQDMKKAQRGGGVVKKLLEQDGLTAGEVDKYLGLLVGRYEQEKSNADGTLRGELLGAMAGLCAQSVYKTEASKRFAPLFEEALSDAADLVREAAVDGLVYIDGTKALKILRKDFVNDNSVIIRRKTADLAGEMGDTGDLSWLAEKAGATVEGEWAWQAMLKIFRRSDAVVLGEWAGRFNVLSTQGKLSDEQMTSFYEIAERRATGENKTEMLKGIREELSRLYIKSGEFKRAAECLGLLISSAATAKEKEEILAKLLGVYLRWPNIKAAKDLVSNCLLEKDMEPNSVVVESINRYLNEPAGGVEPNSVVAELAKIEISETRPMWTEQVKRWMSRFSQTKAANKPVKTTN